MDKKFFTGIILGILIGILIIIFGKQYFLENSKSILLFFFLVLSISFLILIVLYFFRNKLLSAAKLKFITETEIAESASKLTSGLLAKDQSQISNNAESLTKGIINKLIESQTRAWMFRISFALFAILGGIFATLITIQQNEIVENQNTLIKEQGNYLLEMDRPFLNIEPYKFDWNEKGDLINVDLKLELSNIGKRAATKLRYKLEFYEYIENSIELLQPKINEEIINPLSPNSSIVINSTFNKKDNNSTVIVYFDSQFSDPIKEDQIIKREFIYKIPPPSKVPYIPTSLMVGNKIHKELLEEYFRKKE